MTGPTSIRKVKKKSQHKLVTSKHVCVHVLGQWGTVYVWVGIHLFYMCEASFHELAWIMYICDFVGPLISDL